MQKEQKYSAITDERTQTPTPTTTPALAELAAPTPTPAKAANAEVSDSKRSAPTPSATVSFIAELQGSDVNAVEAALVGVRDAQRRGDPSVIEAALIEQATLLQALGNKLLRVAGGTHHFPAIQAYTHLSLRALEGARKTLGMLAGMRSGPKNQTNVQVNVGRPANEFLDVGHE